MHANDMKAPDQRVEIVRKILWLSRRHFHQMTAQAEEKGMGSGQIPVLIELGRWGELSQRELAERTRVTPATMSGTLKRMERDGLILRTTDKKDARVFRVRLTEEGEAQRRSATDAFDESCYRMLSGLSAEERNRLDALLTRLQDNLGGVCCREESSQKE